MVEGDKTMRQLWKSELPEALRNYGMFCMNRNKVPYRVDGIKARPNDIKDFTTYSKAKEHIGDYDGISLGLFTSKSGLNLCAIDIDHCVTKDGEITQFAWNIIRKMQTYAEFSPSGTGIHILFYSHKVWDKDKYYTNKREIVDYETGEVVTCDGVPTGLEIYNSGMTSKVMRCSENPIPSAISDIRECGIDWLLNGLMVKQEIIIDHEDEGEAPHFSESITDYFARDSKLRELYNKTDHDESEGDSQTDMALCCKLAFYTAKDEQRIDELFRSSQWFVSKNDRHKDKWTKRNDYRETTIRKACSLVHYTAKRTETALQGSKSISAVNYTQDDTGNAKRLIDSFGIDLRWNVENKMWMIWNGNYWETDVMNKVRSYVDKMVVAMERELHEFEDENINNATPENPASESDIKYAKSMAKNIAYMRSKRGKDNCLAEAQSVGETPITNSMFDAKTDCICTMNGTYNLKTGDFYENARLDYFTKCINLTPDFKTAPTQFLKFLNNILKKHPETIDFIHRLFGYCLTAETFEQKIFFLYGDGNDGKSVLLDTISKAMGEYACSAKKDLIMNNPQQNTNMNENSLARIKAKRLVWIDEVGSSDKLNEGLVKNVTSGTGEISARFLYANEFTYRFTSKIIVTTNYEPRITGTDRGIWRRIVVLPFDLGLAEKDIDRLLARKLENELPSILGWLIQGAMEYYEHGLSDIPQCSLNMIKEYQEESDEVQIWLDENTYESDDTDCISASQLYEDFLKWTIRENQPKLSQTIWGKNMRKKFKKARINHSTVYYGVRLGVKALDNSKIKMGRAMAETIDEDDI